MFLLWIIKSPLDFTWCSSFPALTSVSFIHSLIFISRGQKESKHTKQLTTSCNNMPLKWKWCDWLCVKRDRKNCNCVTASVAKTQTCIAALFPWVYIAQQLMYIIKNDKSLVDSIYDISVCRHSQTQSGTHQHTVLHTNSLTVERKHAVASVIFCDVNQEPYNFNQHLYSLRKQHHGKFLFQSLMTVDRWHQCNPSNSQ